MGFTATAEVVQDASLMRPCVIGVSKSFRHIASQSAYRKIKTVKIACCRTRALPKRSLTLELEDYIKQKTQNQLEVQLEQIFTVSSLLT